MKCSLLLELEVIALHENFHTFSQELRHVMKVIYIYREETCFKGIQIKKQPIIKTTGVMTKR